MKKTQGSFFVLATVLAMLAAVAPVKAGALDIRLGAGLSTANPKSFESRVNSLSGSDLSAGSFDSYNADAVFHLPIVPIGVGVRYERSSQKQSGSGSEWDLDINNFSVLADWRILNNVVYLGPLVSMGYPWADLKLKNGGSSDSRRLNSKQISYSAGLEAGLRLGRFIVGAEAGYKSVRFKGNASSLDADVNLEGFYGKALVGMTFL
jgi:hypothetical protein